MGKKRKMRSFASRLTGWIMLMMLITMGMVAYLIFELASQFVKEEEFMMHESYVASSVEYIRRITSDVYVGTVNHVPEIERNLGQPDRLAAIMQEIVETNPRIRSCGISFVENYYPQKGRTFSPYAVRLDSTHIEASARTGSECTYLNEKWFTEMLTANEGQWSKAFFENGSSDTPLVAYMHPIHDAQGRTVAVLGADLSLEWLRKKMEETDSVIMKKEWAADWKEKTYSFLIESDGTYLVHPDSSRQLRKTIFDYTKAETDSLPYLMARQMTSGKSGFLGKDEEGKEPLIELDNGYAPEDGFLFDGRESYVFYAPIKYTNWSLGLAVATPNIKLIAGVVGFVLLFLIVIGMLVVYLVCRFTIRRITKPLKQLAASAGEVAKGHFNTTLPNIKNNDEIRLLRDSFEDMQHSLAEYVEELKTTTASKAAMENELQVAHDIQMGMLPKIFPPYPERSDIDIFGTLTPAKEVGGDLFDFHIHDNRLFFCISDVSGKGVPASLLMAVIRSLFRNISSHTTEPHHIVAALNEALATGNDSCMFATLFLGVLDLSNGILRYCNAGHDAPLLIGDGVSTLPCDSNIPLGIVENMAFTQQETVIAPDTTIFLYTDGLTEAENPSHAQFGLTRVKDVAARLARQHSPATVQTTISQMAEAVQEFVSGARQSDDLTMLAIKYMKDNEQQG